MKRSLLGHTLTKGQRIISLILIIFSVMKVSAYKKESIDITVNGQKRNMVVFTPNSFPAKSPLFIVTHGMNQDPEYQYGSDKMSIICMATRIWRC